MPLDSQVAHACATSNTSSLTVLLDNEEVIVKIGRKIWKSHSSPLHSAAMRGHVDIIEMLVEAGIDVNCKSVDPSQGLNVSALHRAIAKNQTDSVNLLLHLGADPEAPSTLCGTKWTPMELAIEMDNADIVKLLQKYAKQGSCDDVKGLPQVPETSPTSQPILSQKPALNKECAQDLLNRLLTLSEKERVLEEAENALEKVKSLEERRSELNKKMEEVLSEINANAEELSKLRRGAKYVDAEALASMKEEIAFLRSFVVDLKSATTESKDDDDGTPSCLVCLKLPTNVYSCGSCVNVICEDCKNQMTSCPTCRTSYEYAPLQRNKLAEKLIGKVI